MNTKPVGEYLSNSYNILKGNWGQPILTCVIYFCISSSFSLIPVLGSLAAIVISGPLAFGFYTYFLSFSRDINNNDVGNLFAGFKNKKFGPALGAYWLSAFAIIGGFVFLIVPGIFIAIRLSMVFFVLNDHENLTAVDAMKASWNMMAGNGAKFFLMGLAFFCISILSVFTLFIGLFWLVPLFQTSYALFYEDVKRQVS